MAEIKTTVHYEGDEVERNSIDAWAILGTELSKLVGRLTDLHALGVDDKRTRDLMDRATKALSEASSRSGSIADRARQWEGTDAHPDPLQSAIDERDWQEGRSDG